MGTYFRKKEATSDTTLHMVHYNAITDIACQLPGWTNVMTNIPQVPRKKPLYQIEGMGSRKTCAIWSPEQKDVWWWKALVEKLTSGGDTVMDLLAVICTGTKARMLLDQHRKTAGCDLDSEVLSAAKPDLLLTFAPQMLSQSSDVKESGEVKEVLRNFREKRAEVLACKRATAWEVPRGLDGLQVTRGHILHLLFMLYEDCRLYEKSRHISLAMWSSV